MMSSQGIFTAWFQDFFILFYFETLPIKQRLLAFGCVCLESNITFFIVTKTWVGCANPTQYLSWRDLCNEVCHLHRHSHWQGDINWNKWDQPDFSLAKIIMIRISNCSQEIKLYHATGIHWDLALNLLEAICL